jgi:hypothetical protein
VTGVTETTIRSGRIASTNLETLHHYDRNSEPQRRMSGTPLLLNPEFAQGLLARGADGLCQAAPKQERPRPRTQKRLVQ